MVDQASKAKQFEGFDLNDYVFIDSSANPFGANNIGLYVVGTQANAQVLPPILNLAFLMALTPVPAAGQPPTSIGPQYPWAYEGVPSQLHLAPANTPSNPTPAQRTLIRVINNDMNVYFLNDRLLNYLVGFLVANPDLAAAANGPSPVVGGGFWPLPLPVTLQVEVGLYEFERKWRWLLYQRTVADADGDLELWIEG